MHVIMPNNVASEKVIERRARLLIRAANGVTIKLALDRSAGWPDTLVLGPYGVVFFIEFKKYNGKPRKLQLHQHRILRKLDHKVYVVTSPIEALRLYKEAVRKQKTSIEAFRN